MFKAAWSARLSPPRTFTVRAGPTIICSFGLLISRILGFMAEFRSITSQVLEAGIVLNCIMTSLSGRLRFK